VTTLLVLGAPASLMGRKVQTSETFIELAMIRLILRRLEREV